MSVTSVPAASRSPTPLMLARERVTAAVPTIVLETPAGQRPVIALATFRIRGSSPLSAPAWCKAATPAPADRAAEVVRSRSHAGPYRCPGSLPLRTEKQQCVSELSDGCVDMRNTNSCSVVTPWHGELPHHPACKADSAHCLRHVIDS